MSPGEVRTVKCGSGNVVVVSHGLWASREGRWIHIHLTGPDDSHTTVTNDPESVRFHRTLFQDLRRTLVKQGCWTFGDEGSEPLDAEVPQSAHPPIDHEVAFRFQPIKLRGAGLSASETMLRDRERF